MSADGHLEDLLAEFEGLAAERVARRARAAALLVGHSLIAVRCYGRECVLMLHRSTVIPDGWQVSCFDADGPVGHADGADLEKTLFHAFDCYEPHDARPMSEPDFVALSQTDSFRRGVEHVMAIAEANRTRRP